MTARALLLATRTFGGALGETLYGAGAIAVLDDTGTTDMTADIQAIIDAAPDGTLGDVTVLDFNPGGAGTPTFRCDGKLSLDGRHYLRMRGHGAELDQVDIIPGITYIDWATDIDNGLSPPVPLGTSGGGGHRTTTIPAPHRINTALTDAQLNEARGRSFFNVGAGATFITIETWTMNGANTNQLAWAGWGGFVYDADLEAQHGINWGHCSDCQGLNNVIHNTYGDGMYLGPDVTNPTAATRVLIQGNIIGNCGRQCIASAKSFTITADDNIFTGSTRSCFDLEPLGNGLPGTADRKIIGWRITNNTASGYKFNFVSAEGTGEVNDIFINNNSLPGKTLSISCKDLSGARRSNWTVTNNEGTGTLGAVGSSAVKDRGAIFFSAVDGLTIHGNTAHFGKGGPGASQLWMWFAILHSCTGYSITGDTLTQALGEFNTW